MSVRRIAIQQLQQQLQHLETGEKIGEISRKLSVAEDKLHFRVIRLILNFESYHYIFRNLSEGNSANYDPEQDD
nr:8893_t:CDS:2 [Entrophospora candida]